MGWLEDLVAALIGNSATRAASKTVNPDKADVIDQVFENLDVPIVSDVIDIAEAGVQVIETFAQLFITLFSPQSRVNKDGKKSLSITKALKVWLSIPVTQMITVIGIGAPLVVATPALIKATVPLIPRTPEFRKTIVVLGVSGGAIIGIIALDRLSFINFLVNNPQLAPTSNDPVQYQSDLGSSRTSYNTRVLERKSTGFESIL